MGRFQAINSNWTLLVLFVLQVPLIFWLVTAHPILTTEVVAGSAFPAGTIIAWMLLFTFPLLTYLFLEKVEQFFHPIVLRMLKRLGMMAVSCGALWGVISYFLAGNWRFSFTQALTNQDERSQAFWFLTILPLFTSLIIGATIAVGAIIAALKSKKQV